MKKFVVVIDNEVAVNLNIPQIEDESEPMYLYFEKLIAALSSNPTIVQTEEAIQEGYIWDGQNFNPPV